MAGYEPEQELPHSMKTADSADVCTVTLNPHARHRPHSPTLAALTRSVTLTPHLQPHRASLLPRVTRP